MRSSIVVLILSLSMLWCWPINVQGRGYTRPEIPEASKDINEQIKNETIKMLANQCELLAAIAAAVGEKYEEANEKIKNASKGLSEVSEAFYRVGKQVGKLPKGELKPPKGPQTDAAREVLNRYGLEDPTTYSQAMEILAKSLTVSTRILDKVRFDGSPADLDRLRQVQDAILRSTAPFIAVTTLTVRSQ